MERKSFVSKLFWDVCVMVELWESVPKGSTERKTLCGVKAAEGRKDGRLTCPAGNAALCTHGTLLFSPIC